MKTERGAVLKELETVLATALCEHPFTGCNKTRCLKKTTAAAQVAERIVDSIALKCGGLHIYFKIGNSIDMCSSGLVSTTEEFLMELENSMRQELPDGSSLSVCSGCTATHCDWDEAINAMTGEVYATFRGQHVYISCDTKRRNKLILQEFSGDNHVQLGRKYKLTPDSIYRVIRDGKRQQALSRAKF